MQLSILIIKVILIELLLKLGRFNIFIMRHTEIFILSGSLTKNVIFPRKKLSTELFPANFILIKSKYILQINT